MSTQTVNVTDDESGKSLGKKDEPEPKRKRPKQLFIPRRIPSVVIEIKKVFPWTPVDTDSPYKYSKKINRCQNSPLTLYELTARIVDSLVFPEALLWTEEQVADWIDHELGFPQYRSCIYDNFINGMRLLMLEDGSKVARINIHDFDHIKKISSAVRCLYKVEFIQFLRSIGLPYRYPLTHCTWFKSRTGPTWGIRQNWTRSDILRAMMIINPEPLHLDHWDLVWYRKPDFPKMMFARIPKAVKSDTIPHYNPRRCPSLNKEIMIPRKFRFQTGIRESQQKIWIEEVPLPKPKKIKKPPVKPSRLAPKVINLNDFKGDQLKLAQRKVPKPKFFLI